MTIVKTFSRLASVCTVVALAIGLVLVVGGQPRAQAAIAGDFDPGNIISDTVFFNPSSMSTAQIQTFLDTRGANCVAGEEACLKGYSTTTGSRTSDGLCTGYPGGLTQTAAQIISGVARSCGINPQVLLVLLDKEQGLVSRTRPTTSAYRAATGFGCPDTAACDSTYYGFFNQLYSAARQYQVYASKPGSYRYKAGQNNAIQYNPNASCGSSTVFIANQATAGLYNYTPYQPNASALANLYGSGDACGAYGNRNFWRIFSDWFGDPQTASRLLRTADNPAVYVVSGSSKYVVPDLGTLGALAPLGSVGYVSQQYLDRRTTDGAQGRIVLGPSGGVFFIDAGIRLPFGSCAQVADFGGSCDSLVRWDQSLIDAFVAGPSMTSLYRTTSGKAFYVSGGAKREVVDDQALAQAGLSTSGVRLLETGLASLPYGVPVTRDGVVVQVRGGGSPVVASGGGFTQVTEGVRAGSSLAALPVRALDAGSVARLSGVVSVPGALVAGAGGSGVFLLSEAGKRQVLDPAAVPGSPVVVSASFLGLFGDGAGVPVGAFVKGAQSSAVYALEGGVRRKVSSWADLVAFAGSADPVVVSVDQRIVDALPLGAARLPLGALVHSPRSGAVFLVNNARELIPLGSFSVSNELGATRVVAVSNADVDGYTVRGSGLGTAVDCAGTRYLGLGGRLYSVGSDVADAYRLTFTQVDPLACAALPKAGAPLTRFLRASSGAIYWIDNGTKRPFNSYPGYVAAGGTSANTLQVSDFALSQIPTGAPR